eukprot:TRINITY_DN13390_c0_g1_i1.p1 TRINITY_DN13390_c0_g1~~TRINITY_DN13390_c0_g1_i1.p1  ORF type:complete len:268 (+),score=84.47 TRINITY_DN13390_c0_g1_i1:26-805(+)
MASWGYKENDGPAHWGKLFPVAVEGVRQSPIDIVQCDCEDDSSLSPLAPKFESLDKLALENTGASWKVDYHPEKSSLTGGPLANEYRLVQMHAHWGKEEGRGSEHTLDGKMFDGELHLVHYNTKYADFGEAVDKPDGLAVLGIFLQVGEGEHPEFAKITNMLKNVNKKGDKTELDTELDPAALLPESDCFFTYPGSLTTPPLLESVTWLVYNKPITISKDQIGAMRGMQIGLEEDCGCMVDNYRPVCAKGSRVVKKGKN